MTGRSQERSLANCDREAVIHALWLYRKFVSIHTFLQAATNRRRAGLTTYVAPSTTKPTRHAPKPPHRRCIRGRLAGKRGLAQLVSGRNTGRVDRRQSPKACKNSPNINLRLISCLPVCLRFWRRPAQSVSEVCPPQFRSTCRACLSQGSTVTTLGLIRSAFVPARRKFSQFIPKID